MNETIYQGVALLAQGMAGIFVVLGGIALLVWLVQKIDQKADK